MYQKTLYAGWGDMDFNSHMRNTAFLDKSADVRMLYFSENGFPMAEFVRAGVGPVIMKDEIEYHREVGLLARGGAREGDGAVAGRDSRHHDLVDPASDQTRRSVSQRKGNG